MRERLEALLFSQGDRKLFDLHGPLSELIFAPVLTGRSFSELKVCNDRKLNDAN